MALIEELKRLINKVKNNKEGDEMEKDVKEKEEDCRKVSEAYPIKIMSFYFLYRVSFL